MHADTHLEIERRFIIRMPDASFLSAQGGEIWQIAQTYLSAPGERVRAITQNGNTRHIFTSKKKISETTREETEYEISAEEYRKKLLLSDKERREIKKTRHRIPFEKHVLEIDIFPFWPNQALLEVELAGEEETFSLPEWVSVVREVTFDKRYTNRAMAKQIPGEDPLP